MSREEAREFLPLYALGALSPAERKAVEAALQRDPELWTELAPLLEGASLLAEVPPEPLPPGIEARLFPRRRSRPWTLWPLAAAAALVLVVLGWRGLEAWSWIQALRSPQGEVVALVSPHGGVVGQAWLGPGRRALVLLDLPPPPPGRVYQAWGMGKGAPIPLPTFRGRTVLLYLPQGAQSVAISEEPPGGSRSPTEIVAVPQ